MKLNEDDIDVLTEVINIGAGHAANSLSEITGSRIELAIPSIQVCGTSESKDLSQSLDMDFATIVQQGFEGEVSGQAFLAFPTDNASDLARVVGGIVSSDSEMDEELYGILEEIGNIVLNAVLGSIANLLDYELAYTLPQLSKRKVFSEIIFDKDNKTHQSTSVAVIANTSLAIADREITGSLLLLFEVGNIEKVLSTLTDAMNV